MRVPQQLQAARTRWVENAGNTYAIVAVIGYKGSSVVAATLVCSVCGCCCWWRRLTLVACVSIILLLVDAP